MKLNVENWYRKHDGGKTDSIKTTLGENGHQRSRPSTTRALPLIMHFGEDKNGRMQAQQSGVGMFSSPTSTRDGNFDVGKFEEVRRDVVVVRPSNWGGF